MLRARMLAASLALVLTGCGSSAPGLSDLGRSLIENRVYISGRTPTLRDRQDVPRSPWDVGALRRTAPKPQFSPERRERVGSQTVSVRDVTFPGEPAPGTPVRLAGSLVTPPQSTQDRRRLPALLLVSDAEPLGAEEAARAWAARGYVVLRLDLPGLRRGPEKGSDGALEGSEPALASGSSAGNPLHAAVTAVIAAVNLLAAQPGVDAGRIGVLGEGWGGVAADLACAVDDRPHALLLARAAIPLHRETPREAPKNRSPKGRDAAAEAYDPDTYAKAHHPPTMVMHLLALSEPPLAAVIAMFRARAGVKTLALIPPEAKEGETATAAAWFAARLLREDPLPELRSLRAAGNSAVVTTGGKSSPRSVTLYYTSSDVAQPKWESVTGEKAGDHAWSCRLPEREPGKSLTVFAALTDGRGAIVCSEPGSLPAGERGTPDPRAALAPAH
jgi:dienelactone hydrolase